MRTPEEFLRNWKLPRTDDWNAGMLRTYGQEILHELGLPVDLESGERYMIEPDTIRRVVIALAGEHSTSDKLHGAAAELRKLADKLERL